MNEWEKMIKRAKKRRTNREGYRRWEFWFNEQILIMRLIGWERPGKLLIVLPGVNRRTARGGRDGGRGERETEKDGGEETNRTLTFDVTVMKLRRIRQNFLCTHKNKQTKLTWIDSIRGTGNQSIGEYFAESHGKWVELLFNCLTDLSVKIHAVVLGNNLLLGVVFHKAWFLAPCYFGFPQTQYLFSIQSCKFYL